jgi:hypothetical protein
MFVAPYFLLLPQRCKKPGRVKIGWFVKEMGRSLAFYGKRTAPADGITFEV